MNECRFVLQEGARGGNVSLGWLHTQQEQRDREETFLREKSPLARTFQGKHTQPNSMEKKNRGNSRSLPLVIKP